MNPIASRSNFESSRGAFAALLRGDEVRAASLLETAGSGAFHRFVSDNKLEFHICALASDSPMRLALGPAHLSAIEDFCHEQRLRQHELIEELWKLADVLEGAGINFILLKGLYFAERFYGSVENRFSWDLDVLVRQSDAATVDRLLRRGGYFRRSAVVLSRSLTSRFTHAFDYGNERPRFSVDLHWMLSRHPSLHVDETAMWASRQPHTLLDRRFEVLSHEYEIVSNALSTFRDIQRGAIRLRAFVDLYRLLEVADSRIDWDRFLAKRREERIAAITVNVLAMLFTVLDCGGRFPGSAGMVDRASDLLVELPEGGCARLFDPGRGALANRAWTSSVYECSRTRVAVWWVLSLPFRMAVYRSGRRYANFKRRIHTFKRKLRRLPPARVDAVRKPTR